VQVYLNPTSDQRLLATDKARTPNPDCPVCSPAQSRVLVDMSRATLSNLVEDLLRLQLGYGDEFTVNSEQGLLYDIDETENLNKKLSELGIKGDSFITIVDDEEKNPRVNLVLMIQES
jgi:ubiquitin-like 1-activating enzyme E1 B